MSIFEYLFGYCCCCWNFCYFSLSILLFFFCHDLLAMMLSLLISHAHKIGWALIDVGLLGLRCLANNWQARLLMHRIPYIPYQSFVSHAWALIQLPTVAISMRMHKHAHNLLSPIPKMRSKMFIYIRWFWCTDWKGLNIKSIFACSLHRLIYCALA